MSIKKHIAATSNGLFEIINQALKDQGISTDEFPLSVNKLSLELEGPVETGFDAAATNNLTGPKCAEYKTELRKMTDPHTGKTVIQMVEVCVRWEEG